MADGPGFQAPYFATLPTRLQGVPNLISPMVAGTSTPAALPQQQLPDYMARAKEGVETVQQAMKSKSIAAKAQAEAERAKGEAQWAQMYNNYVKMIQGRTDLDENTKQAYIGIYGALHGTDPAASSDLMKYWLQNWANNPPPGGPIEAYKSFFPKLPTAQQPAGPQGIQPKSPNLVKPQPPAEVKPRSPSDTNGDQSDTETFY